jgi:hypothetical protein
MDLVIVLGKFGLADGVWVVAVVVYSLVGHRFDGLV